MTLYLLFILSSLQNSYAASMPYGGPQVLTQLGEIETKSLETREKKNGTQFAIKSKQERMMTVTPNIGIDDLLNLKILSPKTFGFNLNLNY